MAITGIYKITNSVNKKIYIGSACNYFGRISQHKSELKNNKHGNGRLQNAANKYGIESLTFYLIEECKREMLIEREQFYIDTLKPQYNICNIAGSCIGVKRSESFIEKQRGLKNRLGKKSNEEQRRRLSKAKKEYIKLHPNEISRLTNINLGNTYRMGKSMPIESILSGENHYNHKLKDYRVRVIRSIFVPYSRKFSTRKLGIMYGVSHQQISRIVNNIDRKTV